MLDRQKHLEEEHLAKRMLNKRRQRLLNLLDREMKKPKEQIRILQKSSSTKSNKISGKIPKVHEQTKKKNSLPELVKPLSLSNLLEEQNQSLVLQDSPPSPDQMTVNTIHVNKVKFLLQQKIQQEVKEMERAKQSQAQALRKAAKQLEDEHREQISQKQHKEKEKKQDEQALVEKMAWEQSQIDLYEQEQQVERAIQRWNLRENQVKVIELEQARKQTAQECQTFIEKLAVMPPAQALQNFQSTRGKLVQNCLKKYCKLVDEDQLKEYEEELEERMDKAIQELKHRLRADKRAQELDQEKTKSLVQLKKLQHDQIEAHLLAKQLQKKEERELYTVITQEKLAQDRRINDLQALKRQQKLEHRARLLEQIKNQSEAAELKTMTLTVEGSNGSKVLRTPWWSDEKSAEAVVGFQRTAPSLECFTAVKTPQFGRKAYRWYD